MKKDALAKIVTTVVLSMLTGATALSAQENPELVPRALPAAAGPNDIARFLAGMPVPENSPLAPLMRDPAWQEHAAFFEKEFSKLNLRQLQKLHAWEDTYLPAAMQPIPVAFYMFSGPDFLYVINSSRAAVYILCGKGINGAATRSLRVANLSAALGNLENTMKSAQHHLLHHQRHESRSATAKSQWCIANSLRFHHSRRQIDHPCDVRFFEQQRRLSGERTW
jgi:hypothetical protein